VQTGEVLLRMAAKRRLGPVLGKKSVVGLMPHNIPPDLELLYRVTSHSRHATQLVPCLFYIFQKTWNASRY
jgi:hypothetical protein